MKKTIIVLTTHRGVSDETYEAVVACQSPAVIRVKGVPYVDRARNKAFEATLEAFETAGKHGIDLDCALFIDDDIVVEPRDMQTLIDTARDCKHPVSARYVTAKGRLAGELHPSYPKRWVFGLGCMAVPRASLELVAKGLPFLDERLWCQTGIHPLWGPDTWTPEDYWFCAHFGGVYLHPTVSVGHIKPMILYPRPEGEGLRLVAIGTDLETS